MAKTKQCVGLAGLLAATKTTLTERAEKERPVRQEFAGPRLVSGRHNPRNPFAGSSFRVRTFPKGINRPRSTARATGFCGRKRDSIGDSSSAELSCRRCESRSEANRAGGNIEQLPPRIHPRISLRAKHRRRATATEQIARWIRSIRRRRSSNRSSNRRSNRSNGRSTGKSSGRSRGKIGSKSRGSLRGGRDRSAVAATAGHTRRIAPIDRRGAGPGAATAAVGLCRALPGRGSLVALLFQASFADCVPRGILGGRKSRSGRRSDRSSRGDPVRPRCRENRATMKPHFRQGAVSFRMTGLRETTGACRKRLRELPVLSRLSPASADCRAGTGRGGVRRNRPNRRGQKGKAELRPRHGRCFASRPERRAAGRLGESDQMTIELSRLGFRAVAC